MRDDGGVGGACAKVVHLPLEVSLRGLGEVDSKNHDVDRFG